MDDDSPTAQTLDISQYDTHGFSRGYPLKRHRRESLANEGCFEARQDWARLIGPAREFGCCNPVDGNFTASVLPLCKPERLKQVAYILEYAFLHDTEVEGTESQSVSIQAKMREQLYETDQFCASRVMSAWKTMLATTLRNKDKDFAGLEEYLDFRIIDTGAPFVESVMLFGMAMTMTAEEDAIVADVIRPCYASLALANDYFSFDRERGLMESQPGAHAPISAVWMYMRWRGVDAAAAKELVVQAANRYEQQFLGRCEKFRQHHAPLPPKLDLYLRALAYQVGGNVAWSLRCPRYNPKYRYDPNAGVEDEMTASIRGGELSEPDFSN